MNTQLPMVSNPNSSPMRKYPRVAPSMPSLQTHGRREAVVRRSTTLADLSTATESSLPYLAPSPPLNGHYSNDTEGQLSREGSRRKARRYGFDFNHGLSLEHKQFQTDDTTGDRQKSSVLPLIHTQDDAYMNSAAIRTPSSTYSSSLYTSEPDFEFLQPPVTSPDLNAHRDSPLYTVEETCQVRDFLTKRWGAIDSVKTTMPLPISITSNTTQKTPSYAALPVSIAGDERTGVKWIEHWKEQELGDFSWEAYEGELEVEDQSHDEDTHNLLGKMDLLDNRNGGAPDASVSSRTTRASKIPLPGAVKPLKENADDVSVVLSALRSSIDSQDSNAKVPGEKHSDQDPDRDRGLRQELRKRLKTKSNPEFAGYSPRREASIFYMPSSGVANNNSTSPLHKDEMSGQRAISSQVAPTRKPASALRPSRSSSGLRDARVRPQNPSIRHAANVQDVVHKRSFAFEKLESSISKLQTHSPDHVRGKSQVYPASGHTARRNHRMDPLPFAPSKKAPILEPLETGKPAMYRASRERSSERLQSQPLVRSRDREGYFHARSPSAPAAVLSPKPVIPPVPALSRREMHPAPGTYNDSFKRHVTHKSDNSQQAPPIPPLPPTGKQGTTEGLRSFMDVTPEQKPRHTHTRSRSSMASAAAQAQKARKMLVRASISVANWGKGLARSGSKKS